eukprot:2800478-Rhodomonas_salina.1
MCTAHLGDRVRAHAHRTDLPKPSTLCAHHVRFAKRTFFAISTRGCPGVASADGEPGTRVPWVPGYPGTREPEHLNGTRVPGYPGMILFLPYFSAINFSTRIYCTRVPGLAVEIPARPG